VAAAAVPARTVRLPRLNRRGAPERGHDLDGGTGAELLRDGGGKGREVELAGAAGGRPVLRGQVRLADRAGDVRGEQLVSAALPDMVPSRDPLSEPPQAESSGIPPATAAVATAVETRKLLRLDAEETEGEASSVTASTLHGAPGHPAVGRRLRCPDWNWLS
jgi:hypothetical protein